MTQQHLATPPPELVEWLQDLGNLDAIALAYQAGADQELEACCEWVEANAPGFFKAHEQLRAARRPKPPSLKEQAQQSLLRLANYSNNLMAEDAADMETIRRALEALPE